jgi:TolB-like protein
VQFLFKDYVLDTNRRELKRGLELVATGPRVFDLLVYLIQNRERVVSKDDLLDAVWAGRIVSESTLTSHINAVRKAVGDSGEDQRLIRTIARKGFRFIGQVRQEQPSVAGSSTEPLHLGSAKRQDAPSLPLPDKPSIAVLPFENLSGDSEQEYFADGIVEDITTALSRMRWLFVIARNSSFTYKRRPVDVKQVGRELGVRYIVEGGVRRAANRVRITTQLIDAATGTHIWADRFDGTLDDIFDIQDQVAASVVGAIARRLEQAEFERSKHKPTESLDAYDLFLRGMASFYRGTTEANSEALSLFYRAIDLDQNFASAYAMAGWCYTRRKVDGWVIDRAHEVAEGTRFARLAIELGHDDAVALARCGHTLAHMVGDVDSGIRLVDRALSLNPNLAMAWLLSGWLRAFRGESDAAIDRFAHAMRLSPLDPELFRMQAGTGFAHLLAGRFNEASSWAEEAAGDLPNYLSAVSVMAAANALAGRTAEARRAMLHLRQLDPLLRLSNLENLYPIRRPEDFALWSDGLRKAGLPE